MSFDGFPSLPQHVNERVKRFMSGDLPPAHRNMGIRPDLWCKEADVGRVLFRWPNDGSRDIYDGRVFGGWIAALSDNVDSMCMVTALEEGEGFTTQDLQVKIFRPVSGPEIVIEAWVVNRSKTTGYVEAEWRLPNGKVAASAGQVVSIDGDRLTLQTVSTEEMSDRLAWQRGMLVFDGEPLASALSEVTRYTGVRFEFEDEQVAQIRVGGFYKANDIEGLTRSLQQNLPIRTTQVAPDRIVISSK